MEKNATMAILIPAHDSHMDIVSIFLESMETFFSGCPYELFWTNCGIETGNANIKVIKNSKNASFCSRLQNALNKITADYIWLWIEDYIPTRDIDTKDIEATLAYMAEHDCNYCRMFKSNKKFMIRDRQYQYIYHVDTNMPYGVAINSGIFKREFLQKIIENEEWTVWDLEKNCLKLASNKKLEKCIYDNRKIGEIVHLLYKGKVFRNARRRLFKAGLNLSKMKREDLPIKDSFRIEVFSFIGHRCPLHIRIIAKKIAKKAGMKFASEY